MAVEAPPSRPIAALNNQLCQRDAPGAQRLRHSGTSPTLRYLLDQAFGSVNRPDGEIGTSSAWWIQQGDVASAKLPSQPPRIKPFELVTPVFFQQHGASHTCTGLIAEHLLRWLHRVAGPPLSSTPDACARGGVVLYERRARVTGIMSMLQKELQIDSASRWLPRLFYRILFIRKIDTPAT